MTFRSGVEAPVSVGLLLWLWLWTGHRMVHLFGWNAGRIETRTIRSTVSNALIRVAGYRCTTCGRWEA